MHIDAKELLVLAEIPGIGPARLRALVEHFGGTAGVFDAPRQEFLDIPALDTRTISSILAFPRNGLEDAEARARRQMAVLQRIGSDLISFWDARYPDLLKRLFHPPVFLFAVGALMERDERAVAVVGTRFPSPYGAGLAERFASELALQGFTVVSGLARGVDTIAHRSALRAGGRSIAVVGSGLDVCYPPENRGLADQLAEAGAVVSEFAVGTQPDAVNFPRRNRIISGLSLGTLVIETGTKGGAMITASLALEQNREVFALPAPLTETGKRGTNLLIKEGRAKLTESIEDIVSELGGWNHQPAAPAPPVTPSELTLFEQKVLEVLSQEPLHLDQIASGTGLSAHETLVELLGLELKGFVSPLPGKRFRKA